MPSKSVSYHGKSAAMICLHLRGDEKMVLVDPYRLDSVATTLASIKAHHVICYPYLSSKAPQADLLALVGRCRWVHIDGEHTGSACWHDLALADQLVDERGVLVVDDFLSPRYPQVSAAVFNYMQHHPFSFRMFLCGFFKAYLARPKNVHVYLKMIRDEAELYLIQHGLGERISFFKTTVPDDYNCFGMGRFDGKSMIGLDWDKDKILI